MFYQKDKVKLPPHHIEAVMALTAHNYSQLPKDRKYVLSFSCGKDSILLLETALANGFNPIVYHQYMIEGVSYNQEILDYYEKRGIEINLIESGICDKMQSADLYCINKIEKLKGSGVNPLKKTEAIIEAIEEYDFNIIGIKQTDSPQRKMTITTGGFIHHKTKRCYPIYHWKDKEVWNYIYENDLPVNKSYEMFGRSQDVINCQHLFPLKQQSPQDLDKFIYKFPLIETLFWIKGEKRDKYFQFSDNAKSGSIFNYNRNLDQYFIIAFDSPHQKNWYCEKFFADGEIVYMDGTYFEVAEKEQSDYKPKEKTIYTNSLKDASARFEESKLERNSADNFLIFIFKDIAEKQQWCKINNIPENVNAIDGMKYEIL